MSLINETLYNLKEKGAETIAKEKSEEILVPRAKSKSNPLFSLYSVLTLFTVAILIMAFASIRYLDTSKYYMMTKTYINHWMSQSSSVAINVNNLPASVKIQYYDAIDALNEGNTEEAKMDLKQIINQYPNFTVAKQQYDRLVKY